MKKSTAKLIAATVFSMQAVVSFSSLFWVATSGAAVQPVQVEAAWVRSTVPGQQGTGAFMRLTAKEAMQLVGVSTPVAGVAEVHEMTLIGDVMKMRAVPLLSLPAGKAVELKPGGYHLMLMDLKQALPTGSTVPLTLSLRNAKGVSSTLELAVPVSIRSPSPRASMPADTHKH